MVTIKDSAGNPVPNALFQLSRDYSTNWAGVNQDASASAADDVAVTEFLPVNPQFPESAFTLTHLMPAAPPLRGTSVSEPTVKQPLRLIRIRVPG